MGHKKVKITLISNDLASKCLASLLHNIGYTVYIPSTLIFSHGVIKVDTFFPEKYFWDGLKTEVQVISFKRISTKKDGTVTPTKVVELKFLSPKIPESISINYVIFTVSLFETSVLHFSATTTACVLGIQLHFA